MSNEIMSTASPASASLADTPHLNDTYDRRGLLRLGGLTAATALVVAACGNTEAGTLGRVGEGGTTPVLEDAIVNNGVLMRTMAGIETSLVNAYQHILDGGFLAKSSSTFPDIGDLTDLVTLFQDHHRMAAETFNSLATEAGEEAWECGNSRLDSAFIDQIFQRVEKGIPATDTAAEIAPSDDATRDYINLVQVLESLSATSCQAMVPQVSEAAIRFTTMQVGVRSARQAALLALRINPGGYITATEEAAPVDTTIASPTTVGAAPETGPVATAIPVPVAIPAQFGLLSPVVWVGGAGDENGVRLRFNLETPSLNSLAYPFYSCD